MRVRKAVQLHRKLDFMRRKISKWDGDTLALRKEIIEGLLEQYAIARSMARGDKQQTEVDDTGKQERLSFMKRKEWGKLAQGLADAITSALDSFDAAKMDRDMELLQKMITEVKKKRAQISIKPPQGELPDEVKAKAAALGISPPVSESREDSTAAGSD